MGCSASHSLFQLTLHTALSRATPPVQPSSRVVT